MATGHVLPSQTEAVSSLHRVRAQLSAQPPPNIKPSFIPENNNRRWLLTQAPVDSDRLEAIRRQARQLWSGVGAGIGVGVGGETAATAGGPQSEQPQLQQNRTSYQRHYSTKQLDEPTQLRPTSPNRRNNPHPPLVFLTCRLHNVPGFSNADSATDKATYKVDASQDPAELQARQRFRTKFANRPEDAALRQYAGTDKDPVEEVFGQKLEFRLTTLGRLDDECDQDFVEAKNRMTDWQQAARPSLHRYLKFQGPVERDRLEVRSAGPPQRLVASQLQADRWQQRQQQQRQLRRATTGVAMNQQQSRLVYQPTRVRGDYLIHPMWPPTLPHHRVP